MFMFDQPVVVDTLKYPNTDFVCSQNSRAIFASNRFLNGAKATVLGSGGLTQTFTRFGREKRCRTHVRVHEDSLRGF